MLFTSKLPLNISVYSSEFSVCTYFCQADHSEDDLHWKIMNCYAVTFIIYFFGLTKISAYKEFTASGGNVWTWPEQPYTKCISMVYCRCAAKSEQCQSFVWSQAKPRNNIIITNTQGHFTIYEHIWICDDENQWVLCPDRIQQQR